MPVTAGNGKRPWWAWPALVLGAAGIALFVLVILPQADRIEAVRAFGEHVERTGIEADALWYTEVEVIPLAEARSRDSLR
jgi:hypothetical protein